jgi:heme oxygenase (mycobilin-producing)
MDPVTLVNTFEIDPDQADAFLAGWRERAEFMSRQPGFRSFRMHRALSPDARFQLVNVAEWDNADALRAATAQPEFQESVRRQMSEFEVTANPAVYRVALELNAPS